MKINCSRFACADGSPSPQPSPAGRGRILHRLARSPTTALAGRLGASKAGSPAVSRSQPGTMPLTAESKCRRRPPAGAERGVYAASAGELKGASDLNPLLAALGAVKRRERRAPVFTQLNRSGSGEGQGEGERAESPRTPATVFRNSRPRPRLCRRWEFPVEVARRKHRPDSACPVSAGAKFTPGGSK